MCGASSLLMSVLVPVLVLGASSLLLEFSDIDAFSLLLAAMPAVSKFSDAFSLLLAAMPVVHDSSLLPAVHDASLLLAAMPAVHDSSLLLAKMPAVLDSSSLLLERSRLLYRKGQHHSTEGNTIVPYRKVCGEREAAYEVRAAEKQLSRLRFAK